MGSPHKITNVAVRPVRWPLRRPFVTALGRKTHSDNVLVRVSLSGGGEGWGEASASLAMPWQTGPVMAAALRRLAVRCRGADVRDLEKTSADAWRREPETPTAVAALEVALWDALAQAEGKPLARLWGGREQSLETLISLSAVAPEAVGTRTRAAVRMGFRRLKLKLNGAEGVPLNVERMRAAHRAAPRADLLLDPNQSFSPDLLRELLAAAQRDGLPVRLVEEPFRKHHWGHLRAWRGESMPLILDESVQTPADARKVHRENLAAGVNIKLAKSGVARSRRILADWSEGPTPGVFMIGCMAESRVGLAAAVHFALGVGGFDYADLDSDLILKPTSARGGYVRKGPVLSLPRRPRPGLGVRG